MPKEAYRALMDALYRPDVTSRSVKRNGKYYEVWLNIHTPFQVPESRLHIELHVKGTYWEWSNLFGKQMLAEIPPQDYIVDPDQTQRHPT
jgi:hypothetical protein